MKKTLLSIIALTAFSVNAQNIFRDDFATYTVNSRLSDQGTWHNDQNSPPFIGLTACLPLATCGAKVLTSNLNYLDYGSTNKGIQLTLDVDSVVSKFNTAVTSGDLYVGLVFNLSTVRTAPQDFFRILNGQAFSTTFRMYVKQSGFDFNIGINKSDQLNGVVYSANAYSIGQNHLVIFKYTINPGTNDDVLKVFVDPVFAAGEPLIASAVVNSPTAQPDASVNVDRLAFRQATTAGIPDGTAGLISVSTTWAGLSFLPLANEQFTKSNFDINSSQANQGLLQIKSNINLDNAVLNIYDIQGRMLENKTISLTENNNEIAVKPISNSGIYIVEIVSGDKKIAQKIAIK